MKYFLNLLAILIFVQFAIAQQGNTEGTYINMGGPDVFHEESTFIGDSEFPSYYGTSNTYATSSGQDYAPVSIFHSERYSREISGEILYTVPVPNGTYTVKTHHGELYFGKNSNAPEATAGQRVYDILLEGVLKIDGFDLFHC